LWWGELVHPVALPDVSAAAAAPLVAVDDCSPSNAENCKLGAWQMHVFRRVLAAHRLRYPRICSDIRFHPAYIAGTLLL